MEEEKKYTKRAVGGIGQGAAARQITNGRNYKIVYKNYTPHDTSVVNIIDKTIGKKGAWVARLDGPHRGAEFNHININPKISKLKMPKVDKAGKAMLTKNGRPRMKGYDPHIEVGGSTKALSTGRTLTKTVQYVNKGLIVASVAVDTYRMGCNVKSDYDCGTTRNTVECAANIAGGWGGGSAGAAGGAAVGSLIFPGIGTIVGGIIGGIAGGISGSVGATAITEVISDELDFDIETLYCSYCDYKFKVRRYKKEPRNCPKCGNPNTKVVK